MEKEIKELLQELSSGKRRDYTIVILHSEKEKMEVVKKAEKLDYVSIRSYAFSDSCSIITLKSKGRQALKKEQDFV